MGFRPSARQAAIARFRAWRGQSAKGIVRIEVPKRDFGSRLPAGAALGIQFQLHVRQPFMDAGTGNRDKIPIECCREHPAREAYASLCGNAGRHIFSTRKVQQVTEQNPCSTRLALSIRLHQRTCTLTGSDFRK